MLDCDKPCFNLCDKVPVCFGEDAVVDTTLQAPADGDYTIVYEMSGFQKMETANFAQGADIIFDLCLNEDYCYTATVLDSEDNPLEITEDGSTYTCFCFCTIMKG